MRRPLETLWRGCSRSLFYLVVAFGVMLFFSTVYISRHSARSEHQQSLTITVPVSNNNDFSRIRCTEPQSLKSSCHAQNVCYNNDHLVVYSDDKELRRRFDGQSFLLGPMHRQPLRPDRLKGWHYDYELRMTTRVQPNHAAKRSQMMFVDEQVLMIGMTGFGHYGHWLMDAVAPAFHMMRRWARLDYNSRIWMKKRQPDQTPQSMADGWTSLAKHGLETMEDYVERAEKQGKMLCMRNIMWGVQIGAFTETYDYYDHFALRDWFIQNMGIKVPSPTRPKLLFTTRPCPQSRCIVNESELIAMLTENFGDVMDIELVNFQGMNLRQQIEAVQGATILMGSSGTGTHNGIFLRNGSALVDIVSDTVNVGQVASEYFVNAHICNANSPSVILCHPMYEKPETNLTRTELINHTDWIMVRSLPLRVHLRRMRLTVETSILNHGLNEELINEMLTAQISERGHAYKFWS